MRVGPGVLREGGHTDAAPTPTLTLTLTLTLTTNPNPNQADVSMLLDEHFEAMREKFNGKTVR